MIEENKTLSEKIGRLWKEINGGYIHLAKELPKNCKVVKFSTVKDIIKTRNKLDRDFIKNRKSRIANQLRIHWNWLKNKTSKEIIEFVNNIINKGAGTGLTQTLQKKKKKKK